MLERATACLKVGARDSLRCACHGPRSRRMLHSTFWTHGAGDLDLPPWALSLLPTPSDLPLKDQSESETRSRRLQRTPKTPAPDPLFLDFLYPPQALAWLHRGKSQQLERWEKRDMKRLPEGFVQASRSYSSRSYTNATNSAVEAEEESGTSAASDFVPLTEETEKQTEAEIRDNSSESSGDLTPTVDRPPDPVYTGANALHRLRQLLSGVHKIPQRREVNYAWSLYRSLDEDDKSNALLKKAFLFWLNVKKTIAASRHCISLYHSIPLDQRQLDVYQAALRSFLLRKDYESATELHQEALVNISNGSQITKSLFHYALERGQWVLALEVYRVLEKQSSSPGQAHQLATFWFHVAEIARLPWLAHRFIKCIRFWQSRSMFLEHLPGLIKLSNSMTEQAMMHICRPVKRGNKTRLAAAVPPVSGTLIDHLAEHSREAQKILATTLPPVVELAYKGDHSLFLTMSHMYTTYCKLPETKPSKTLLMALLESVKKYQDANYRVAEGGLSVPDVFDSWTRFHGRPDIVMLEKLVSFHARHGQVEQVARSIEYAKRAYPDYKDHRRVLWASVYVHARLADPVRALHAFEELGTYARAHGSQPDVWSWGSLLHAYQQVDDLDGVLTSFQRLVKTGLKPNRTMIHQITTMMAKRGDVEGVERMIEYCSDLWDEPLNARLIGSRLVALVRSKQTDAAESVLLKEIERHSSRSDTPPSESLTVCCNIVLTAYATQPYIEGVMRIYRTMTTNSIAMDAQTYSALMLVLVEYRQTDAAKHVMTRTMARKEIRPTPFHYALLMNGYMKERGYVLVIALWNEMRKHNIRPSMETRRIYLRATALFEHESQEGKHARELADWSVVKDKAQSSHFTAAEEIRAAMEEHQASELTEKGPRHGVDPTAPANGLNEYVDYAMFIKGRANKLETVEELFRMYEDEVARRGLAAGPPPMRMLVALMNAHFHARNFDQVESYWEVAKKQADKFSAIRSVPDFRLSDIAASAGHGALGDGQHSTTQADTGGADAAEIGISSTAGGSGLDVQEPDPRTDQSKNFKVAPARAGILCRPLMYYLRTLLYQKRTGDMIKIVTQLLTQGYTLDDILWNRFIEYLSQAPTPPLLLAFILTEHYLMPGFPGWIARPERKKRPKPYHRDAGHHFMRVRRENHHALMPKYRTLLYLARALEDLRKWETFAGETPDERQLSEMEKLRGSVRDIAQRAPKTMVAINTIPRMREKWQDIILRQ